MHDARFDASTRRRFGLAAGGLVASLAGRATVADGAAKRKRKKCKKPEKRCGKRCVKGNCCPGKPCGGAGACYCGRTIGGKTICLQPSNVVCVQCDGDAGCAAPLRCARAPGCAPVTAICLPPCGAAP